MNIDKEDKEAQRHHSECLKANRAFGESLFGEYLEFIGGKSCFDSPQDLEDTYNSIINKMYQVLTKEHIFYIHEIYAQQMITARRIYMNRFPRLQPKRR